jgi:hypothetical protein
MERQSRAPFPLTSSEGLDNRGQGKTGNPSK